VIDNTTTVDGTLDFQGRNLLDVDVMTFGEPGGPNSLPSITFGRNNSTNLTVRADTINFGAPGSTFSNGNVSISGNLSTGGNKDFVIDHPTEEGYKLRHGSYEGPVTGGLVYRARVDVINGSGKPDFPDYVLQNEFGDDWVTSITPTDHFGSAYLDTDTWTVHADTDGKYDVVVYGQRTSREALAGRGGITTRKDDESWTDAADRFYDPTSNTDIDTVEMVSGVSDIDSMRPQAHETVQERRLDSQTDQTTDTTTDTSTDTTTN
jgi:hypothetical protein